MNDSVVTTTENASNYTEASIFSLAAGEIVLGTVVAINDDGNPLVSYPQVAHLPLQVAISTIAVNPQHVGRQAAMLFANGDILKPIIIGFIHSPLIALLENFSETESAERIADNVSSTTDAYNATNEAQSRLETIRVDGKKVVIEGQEEIVLSCGDASITLTKAGKILIRGKYLLSRSSGVNRILGGSVQVN